MTERTTDQRTPIELAWEKYRETEEYRASRQWVEDLGLSEKYLSGYLWTAYAQGYADGLHAAVEMMSEES